MKLMVFNGSPKKGRNNTEILIKKFLEGFSENGNNSYEILKLNECPDIDIAVNKFLENEFIFVAFPLYVYFMPSGVLEFFERFKAYQEKIKSKKIFFLVQYGFPEAVHARPLEKYLEKATGELGMNYLGTIIKGGCNNLIDAPDNPFFNKIFKTIFLIGKNFGETGSLDKDLIDKFSKPENITLISKLLMKVATGLANKFYWRAELVRNNALERAYDRPYLKS
jgi:hypothetical protein